ncbi:SMP-30/gluconolactonase/LRE family protein [Cupriavidus basilensis]|uniref:Gluconolactonase n=1 Tax=Cupriavidus basilensis TaxID=68895 RepID=A0A0C4YAW6_9BURK|nr:SMP-30/gluconolactonase/LRE family protein [Cupriavidus basilensis]AJG19399.1 Gluconolactonase [Cupriavidus basilensis]
MFLRHFRPHRSQSGKLSRRRFLACCGGAALAAQAVARESGPLAATRLQEPVVLDERFQDVLQPGQLLERLATGAIWSEGPVWVPRLQSVLWSDIPNNRLLRWSAAGMEVFRQPAQFTNGHTLDLQGRLVSCEHGRRCISRTEADGKVVILADRYKGKRLNSPNDVVVRSDGSIWFTDPSYGILSDREGYKADQEQPGRHVYRMDPVTGALEVVADDFVQPNGLAFSPDESKLYISDTSASHDPDGNHHVRVLDVATNGRPGKRLASGGVFTVISPGLPDGLRVDRQGRVYITAEDGVHVHAPDGTALGHIAVPEKTGNCTFGSAPGSAARNRLYIAASSSLYAITLITTGAGHA